MTPFAQQAVASISHASIPVFAPDVQTQVVDILLDDIRNGRHNSQLDCLGPYACTFARISPHWVPQSLERPCMIPVGYEIKEFGTYGRSCGTAMLVVDYDANRAPGPPFHFMLSGFFNEVTGRGHLFAFKRVGDEGILSMMRHFITD